MSKYKEGVIENHLVQRVLALGGMCPKWVSPGLTGVPDRIVMLPYSEICFVEVKAEDGQLSVRQQRVIAAIEALQGPQVFVFSSEEEVDEWLDEWVAAHDEFMKASGPTEHDKVN